MASLHAGGLLARRYRLIDRIGAGGMSIIWRARDEVLDRMVAVKVLAAALAADVKFREMVREEARSAAQLVHPHVTSVHDYGETLAPDGTVTAFVVMELLTGEELEALLTAGPLPWVEAVEICAQVAEALSAAHRMGVVHRDITPSNIMMTANGAKLLDFGIATHIGAPDEDEDGETFGTPAYVAPERLDGTPAQPATDTYSLGVLLYETLTGQVPFPAETWDDLTHALRDGTVPSALDVPQLPPAVADICFRCLARNPLDRPTAHQVAEVLRDQLVFSDQSATAALAPIAAPPAIVAPVPDPIRAEPYPVAQPLRPPGPDPGPASVASASTGDRSLAVAEPAPTGNPPRRITGRAVTIAATALVALTATLLITTSLFNGRRAEHRDPPAASGPSESAPPAPLPTGTTPLGSHSSGSPLTGPPLPESSPSGASSDRSALPRPPSGGNPAFTQSSVPDQQHSKVPTAASPTISEAVTELDQIISFGVTTGEIRDDAGLDLQNYLRNLRAALINGPVDLAPLVAHLRAKVATRANEGAIAPRYAQRLDAALVQLATAK